MVSADILLQSPRFLGARVKRVEDPKLITGAGSYIDDVRLPGTLHVQIVRSPYAHARILSIKTDKARSMPGVVAIYTGKDVQAAGKLPPANLPNVNMSDRWLLCVDRVRHVGDPVVAVVAESRYQARDAAMAVEVEYEPLPAVASIAQALAPGAPQLHERAPGNIAYVRTLTHGDVEAAFRQADRIVRGRLWQPKLVPMFLEPRAVLASWDRGERKLTIWASTQGAHNAKRTYCTFLGLPDHQVRVIAPDIGGSFGAKGGAYPDDLLVPWMALRLGRPVKYVEDRRDTFVQTGHGRGQLNEFEAAVTNDGMLLGFRVKLTADIGAYATQSGLGQPMRTWDMGVGVYRVKNVEYQLTGVYTNETSSTAYRGAGRPEAAYLVERMIEHIAYDLGLDPIEVRRRNFIRPDEFPYPTPTGRTYDTGNYEGALDLVLKTAGYEELRRWQAEQRAQGKIVGIGVSTFVEIAGGQPTQPDAPRGAAEHTTIRVDPSGSVTVLTGSSPHGQGTATSYTQIVADALGVPLERIRVVHGDTDQVHFGTGTGGSRTMVVGGSSVVTAAGKLREKVHRVAAFMLEANPEDIVLEGDRYIVRGTPARGLTFAEIARRAYSPYGFPKDLEPGLDAIAYWEPEAPVFPFGAHLVVVEIDRDTGHVKLLRYVAVDDVGKIVSPVLMEGQVHGGVAQGIAAALYEGVVYDENGQLVTATLMDYAAIRADNLPFIETAHQLTPTPLNPLGAKGVGEAGTTGATPAVANAVMDALKPFGIRHLDMPLTPEKVWRAIHGQT